MKYFTSTGPIRLIHIFYLHFFIYLFNTLNIPVFLQQSGRLIMTLIYFYLVLHIFIVYKQVKTKYFFLGVLSVIGLLLIQLILNQKLPHTTAYFIILYLIFQNFKMKESEVVLFLNFTFIIYFTISLIVYIFPSLPIIDYEPWTYPNRLFSGLSRFLGIESSPAAIDTFAGLVLLVNFRFRKESIRFYLWPGNILAILTLLWTSSYSPIVAFIVALIFSYLFFKYRIISYTIISFLPFFLVFIYRLKHINLNLFLQRITAYRIDIWNSMLNVFDQRTIFGKFIGTGSIPEILWREEITANPHYFSLFLIFLTGFIFSFIVFLIVLKNLYPIKEKYIILIILFLLLSSQTNRFIISMYNPVYLIVLLFYLNISRKQLE